MVMQPHQFMEMSDEQLIEYTLSGQEDSYVHKLGQTALTLRYQQRACEAAEKQAADARETLKATREMAKFTLWVAIGTATVAVATFATVLISAFR